MKLNGLAGNEYAVKKKKWFALFAVLEVDLIVFNLEVFMCSLYWIEIMIFPKKYGITFWEKKFQQEKNAALREL